MNLRNKSILVEEVLLMFLFSIALIVRFDQIESIPPGFAGHAASHFAHVVYPFLSSKTTLSDKIAIFLTIETGPIGLIESLGYRIWGVSLVSARFLPAIVGSISVFVAYVFGKKLTGGEKIYGFILGIFVCFSFWHITYSRYENLEHILVPLHYLLTILFFLKSLEKSQRVIWFILLGISLGCIFYIYQTNTILLILIPVYTFILFINLFHFQKDIVITQKIKLIFKYILLLVFFIIVIYPQVSVYVKKGKLIPIRKDYNVHSLYYFVDIKTAFFQFPRFVEVLTINHYDPWLGGSGRVFNVMEITFFIIGLIYIGRDLIKRKRLLIHSIFLLTFILGAIPGIFGPTDFAFRRVMISGFAVLMISAFGLYSLLTFVYKNPLYTHMVLYVGLPVIIFSLFFNSLNYYKGPFSIESNYQYVNRKIVEYVVRNIKTDHFTIVKAHGGERDEVRNLLLISGYSYIKNIYRTPKEFQYYSFCFLENRFNDTPYCLDMLKDSVSDGIIVTYNLWEKFKQQMPDFVFQKYSQIYEYIFNNVKLFIILKREKTS